MTAITNINEGGNAIPNSKPVNKSDVKLVIDKAINLLPSEIAKGVQVDIGSAGYKIESGDIDVFVEAQDVVDYFETGSARDPVKDAKQLLKKYFQDKGVQSVVIGRNVHIGIPYKNSSGAASTAQVDVMVIPEAATVAPWHQHGPRGMYDQPEFRGSDLFILINSLAKFYNLKFDAFGAKLMHRETNEVVARTRKEVAKILLNPKALESDLNSVQSIMSALESDPDREGKLAQARQDAAKGLIKLPETVQVGTAAWFRHLTNRINEKL